MLLGLSTASDEWKPFDFKPVGRPERDDQGHVTLEEDDLDILTSISKPYFQFTIVD